jgi:hypothetical protein
MIPGNVPCGVCCVPCMGLGRIEGVGGREAVCLECHGIGSRWGHGGNLSDLEVAFQARVILVGESWQWQQDMIESVVALAAVKGWAREHKRS